jgi:dephospho-CoA kinase
MNNKIKIIGVTGNSGSGVSTTAKYLQQHNGYVIVADEITKYIYLRDSSVRTKLLMTFGTKILYDNSLAINKKKLSDIVFSDKTMLKKLNEITHPAIINTIIYAIKSLYFKQKQYKFIIIDAPLLVETGLYKIVDEVWLVYADLRNKVDRISNRDNISDKSKIYNRLNSQLDFNQAKNIADFVIVNNKTLEELKRNVDKIFNISNSQSND